MSEIDLNEKEQSRLDKLGQQIQEKHFTLERTTSRSKMVIAKWFNEANNLLATGGCQSKFEPWVNSLDIGLKKSSAYVYIAIYRAFGQNQNFERIVWSAMKELAKDENQKARDEALAEASQGKRVTIKRANELIAKCQPKSSTVRTNTSERPQSETIRPQASQKRAPSEAPPQPETVSSQPPVEPFEYSLGDGGKVTILPPAGKNRIEYQYIAALHVLECYVRDTQRQDDLRSITGQLMAELLLRTGLEDSGNIAA